MPGKAALRTVVGALLAIVDSFDFEELMQGPSHVASFFVVRIAAERLDGMDYWLLEEAGRIARMKVLWRPFPAIAAVQQRQDGGTLATVGPTLGSKLAPKSRCHGGAWMEGLLSGPPSLCPSGTLLPRESKAPFCGSGG